MAILLFCKLVYLRSILLQDCIHEHWNGLDTAAIENFEFMASNIGVHANDIPLLISICSAYDTKIGELFQRKAAS
ncbi:uncharacterized protein BYT42DRAFT_93061 [Radiomyces spectabilis]|uniref:uncharacterized protein n=1 Tax=Radiomyces spectabilis TaxID=64574 RepID=UPI00221E49E1|nr:uncharacterized protein BYT42DRAFT_93061 [Radiomyces spectabilis]KAI8370555.1 hypothetical protein BYT42DRAFT_93061 [Radiomyces spectabilis]